MVERAGRSLAHLMDRLQLATTLTLPLDAVTQTFAILALRGARKTHAATVLVEEIVSERLPVVIIDSAGVWHGLRSSADGKNAGLPVYVFGGSHGELSFTQTSALVVADLVTQLRQPVVLDLSLFSRNAARQFLSDFARHVLRRNREILHLVVDEADTLIPRRLEPEGTHVMDLVRCGPASGIGVTLVSQHPALLNAQVLMEAEVLIAARMTGPLDRAAIWRWFERHADPHEGRGMIESLDSLADDEAWVCSPAWLKATQRVHVRPRATYDGLIAARVGKLRPPQSGAAMAELDRLNAKMGAFIDGATVEGDGLQHTGPGGEVMPDGALGLDLPAQDPAEPVELAAPLPPRRRGRPVELLVLTAEEKEILRQYAGDRRVSPVLAQRAQIVLECAEGRLNGDVARELNVTIQAVGRWRRRFVEYRLDGLILNLSFLNHGSRGAAGSRGKTAATRN
jgi:helix-turn-helix protein